MHSAKSPDKNWFIPLNLDDQTMNLKKTIQLFCVTLIKIAQDLKCCVIHSGTSSLEQKWSIILNLKVENINQKRKKRERSCSV